MVEQGKTRICPERTKVTLNFPSGKVLLDPYHSIAHYQRKSYVMFLVFSRTLFPRIPTPIFQPFFSYEFALPFVADLYIVFLSACQANSITQACQTDKFNRSDLI